MTNTIDTSRAQFEAWNPIRGNVRHKPSEGYYDDYVDSLRQAQWEGWQAARAQPTPEHSSAVDPQIDGYPLWSGLPPPVMSDSTIAKLCHRNLGVLCGANVLAFAQAILSAQSDHSEDKLDMVAQSTDAESVSKKDAEIDRLRDALARLRNECDLEGLRNRAGFDCWLKLADEVLADQSDAGIAAPPITQPLIAEAPREDISEKDKILAAIQCVCVSANQEFSRGNGNLPDWDAGFFAGQLHIFDFYLNADKDAIGEAMDYIAKLRESSRDDVAGDAKDRIANIGTLRPILYTDEINGVQVCQDDLWLVTTKQLEAITASKKDAT